MTRALTLTEHINALCSDGTTRRFYVDQGAAQFSSDVCGHVMYQGLPTHGHLDDSKGKYVFVAHTKTVIPQTTGWLRSANCSAIKHCDRTRRCVGGCVK